MKFFERIGITVSFMGILALSALLKGLVLSVMWGWFMVPLGLPSISVGLAVGVSLVISYLTYHAIREPEDDRSFWKQLGEQLGISLARPGVAILMGWLIHFFV